LGHKKDKAKLVLDRKKAARHKKPRRLFSFTGIIELLIILEFKWRIQRAKQGEQKGYEQKGNEPKKHF
jgi:hypothetical protein